MLVTLSGIVILAKLLQPEKALLPMLVTLPGIVILAKLLQPRKTSSLMVVSLLFSPIATLVSPVQL